MIAYLWNWDWKSLAKRIYRPDANAFWPARSEGDLLVLTFKNDTRKANGGSKCERDWNIVVKFCDIAVIRKVSQLKAFSTQLRLAALIDPEI